MQDRVKPRTRNVALAVDADLLASAEAAGIDPASLLDRALRAELVSPRGKGLSDDDRAAIELHNKFVAEHGSWIVDREQLRGGAAARCLLASIESGSGALSLLDCAAKRSGARARHVDRGSTRAV